MLDFSEGLLDFDSVLDFVGKNLWFGCVQSKLLLIDNLEDISVQDGSEDTSETSESTESHDLR